ALVAPRPSLLKVGSLDSMNALTVLAVESSAAYSLGHLLFVKGNMLLAQPFDAAALRLTADAFNASAVSRSAAASNGCARSILPFTNRRCPSEYAADDSTANTVRAFIESSEPTFKSEGRGATNA